MEPQLLLYSSVGCHLCEGLAERLAALEPAPSLVVVDVDADPLLQARYGLQVPVLARWHGGTWQPLPPVPPRLKGERLADWLRKNSFPSPST